MFNLIDVSIKGVTPLLMHRFPLEPGMSEEQLTREEAAERYTYRMSNEDPNADPAKQNLCIPGINLQRAFVAGAAYSKGKGRSTLAKKAAAAILIPSMELDLKTTKYVIDTRPVVISATKGRIVRHRPRLDQWNVDFQLQYNPELLTESQVRKVVDDTGALVGVLDFRPEKKGPFGTFMITSWKAHTG